jgi:hypothetical protein
VTAGDERDAELPPPSPLLPPPPPPPGIRPTEPRRRWLAGSLLFGPLIAPVVVPFFGALASLVTFGVAPIQGPTVWPGASRRTCSRAALVAFLAFWAIPAFSIAGLVGSFTEFFLIPLCAPDGMGYLVPGAVALSLYIAGCYASARLGRPWLWPVASFSCVIAWALMQRVVVAAGHEWVC